MPTGRRSSSGECEAVVTPAPGCFACAVSQAPRSSGAAPCVTHRFEKLQLLSCPTAAFHSFSPWASHTAFPKCRKAVPGASACPQSRCSEGEASGISGVPGAGCARFGGVPLARRRFSCSPRGRAARDNLGRARPWGDNEEQGLSRSRVRPGSPRQRGLLRQSLG